MNENLDLTQILKGCEGITLYSTIFGTVIFKAISLGGNHPIKFTICSSNGEESVTRAGRHQDIFEGECTLFPSKDQRDWSKFIKPIPIDTPVMVSNTGDTWYLRFYAGSNKCFDSGLKSNQTGFLTSWTYIVPAAIFNFTNPESNTSESI